MQPLNGGRLGIMVQALVERQKDLACLLADCHRGHSRTGGVRILLPGTPAQLFTAR
jgi:hypothetical protein